MMRAGAVPVLAHFASMKNASLIEYGGGHAGAYPLQRADFLPWEVEEMLEAGEETFEHESAMMRDMVNDALTRCSSSVKVSVLETTW
jgi:hypothetical protein